MNPKHENFQTIAPPGTIIELAEITQLPAFEDMVALQLDPHMTIQQREAWVGRVPLRNIVRPPRFNGTIRDIRLEVMAEPYDRLLDAGQRGVRLGRGGNFGNRPGMNEHQEPSYQGYTFLAEAVSSGRGTAGKIIAELWYRSAPLEKSGNGFAKNVDKYGGSSVHRIESKPQFDPEPFAAIRADSKRIALEELRRQLRSPIITPMRS